MSNLSIENISQVTQSAAVPSDRLYLDEDTSQKLSVTPSGDQSGHLHTSGKNFSDILKDSLEKVNEYQVQSDTAIKELVAGKNKNIHETLLTIERADTSLKLMMQVRNKILDAYKEIMRMQV